MIILFTTQLPAAGFTRLQNHQLIIPEKPYFQAEELMQLMPNADVLIATYDFPVPARLLEAGKKLQLVANFGVGFNNIDIEWCKAHHILVTNTPLPVIEPTAEHCFALIHAIAHRTAELDRKLRLPDYGGIRFGVMNNLGVSLYGKQLGIIGMGRIGQALARRALACGMNVVYHNRHQLPADIEQRYQATYVSQEELLRTSDYVSLNLPYTPEVHHLIDTNALSMMKPSAILINTARGAHVHEQALVDALKAKLIAGAALDVYEKEPAIHPDLLTMDNVVLSPHIGTGTIDGRMDMCRNVEDNIIFLLADQKEQMNLVY